MSFGSRALKRITPSFDSCAPATIEVGAGAIDLQQAGGRVWVFAPSAADDRRGLPFAERVLEVDPDSNRIVRTIRTRGQVVVNGLASDGTSVWAADTTNGRLYRITA